MDKTTEALIQILKRFGDAESLNLVKGLTDQAKLDAQKQYDNELLSTALMKKQQGRGMTNTEIAAMHAMDKIKINPPKPLEQPEPIKFGDTKTNMLVGKDSLSLEARISAIESLLSGLNTQTSITVCGLGTRMFLTSS